MKVQSIILASFYVLSVYSAGTIRPTTVKPALKPVVKPGTPPSGVHPTHPTVPAHPTGPKMPPAKRPMFGMNVEQFANANREFNAFISKFPKTLTKAEIIDFLKSHFATLTIPPAPGPIPVDIPRRPKPIAKPVKKP